MLILHSTIILLLYFVKLHTKCLILLLLYFTFINIHSLVKGQFLCFDPQPTFIYIIFSFILQTYLSCANHHLSHGSLQLFLFIAVCVTKSRTYSLTCTPFTFLPSSSCLFSVLQNRSQLTRLASICQVTLFHLQLLMLLFCSYSFQVVHFSLALCDAL